MPAKAAPRVEYDVAKDNLTSFAGLPFIARLARFVDLGPALRSRVHVKKRRRGCRDDETLLALILALCTGGGHLNSVDTLAADTAVCRAAGLRAVPGSRRLGEFLTRLSDQALAGLQECARVVARRLTPAIVRHCVATWEYVPVFVDGTGIEVQGHHCDGTARGSNGEKQYWLHSVFVGAAWVSARLNEDATDGQGDWREQLETDVAPLLAAGNPVWLRADNAYYYGALAAYCRERGWDYSISVTDSRKKRPVLRIVAAMELADRDWTPLDPERREEAALVFYKPKSWKEEEVYVVVRQQYEGQQKLLEPRYTVILTSRCDLPLPEVVRRHRGKQGQENAQKGPLTELGLHHPPCKSYVANQAFDPCGQIAQWLLELVQYQLLPEKARQHGLRPLIRDFVQTAGRLTCSGRRLRMLLGRGNLRLPWLMHATGKLEPA